jgi:SAM-dependent methyltransferase
VNPHEEKGKVKWQLRCLISIAKGLLPFQEQLRRVKDLILGYERNPKQDAATIRDGLTMIEWLGDLSGKIVLEVGSGWQPMLPTLFSLAGAKKVYMTDRHRLMRKDTIDAAEKSISENWNQIAARLPGAERRLGQERDLEYLAPCDCRNLPLPDGSVDVVLSRACLEHIPPEVIAGIFREARRILRSDGLMLHEIDYSDHWSHRDRSITAVNFLQYPDWLFRLTCIHAQTYQNRLRHPEFVEMMETEGFVVRKVETIVSQPCRHALAKMPVAARFRRFSTVDMATTSSIVLTEKAKLV